MTRLSFETPENETRIAVARNKPCRGCGRSWAECDGGWMRFAEDVALEASWACSECFDAEPKPPGWGAGEPNARLLVHITRKSDGKTIIVDDGVYPRAWPADDKRPETMTGHDLAEFYWLEGNGACDCSCAEKMGDPATPCGDSTYDIRLEWRLC